MKPATLRCIFNLWPPFLFAGIRVQAITPDWRHARVRLKLAWYNRNYVRTHFGGSLFAMTDPFWMILVMHNLGNRYLVWDKSGEIDFISPGREDVYAQFDLDETVLDELRNAAASGEKVLRWFDADVKTASGEPIARVRKQLYVRLKPEYRPAAT